MANFVLRAFDPENISLAGVAVGTLWCPSDATVSQTQTITSSFGYTNLPPGNWRQTYTSYHGFEGFWALRILLSDTTYSQRVAEMNGVIFGQSAVKVGDITDGTSNTLLFAEVGHGLIDPASRNCYHFWNSGYYADALAEALYPINLQRTNYGLASGNVDPDDVAATASSFHPGGANFAMCDGSVRFLKDTIDRWQIDPNSALPVGVTYDNTNRVYSIAPGAKVGVYQALSSRAGGEVVSADQY
jgi:prepilin-type processing-associated H-X9-DG protein